MRAFAQPLDSARGDNGSDPDELRETIEMLVAGMEHEIELQG